MSKVHWHAPFKGVFTPIAKGPEEGPFLCVTFNIDYAPFIRGALFAMLQRQMWSGTPTEVDAMIVKVQHLLYMFGQLTACELPAEPMEGYEEMASLCESLRFHNGKLQALCCGDWVDIDGSEGIDLGGTPGPTEEPPPGGQGGEKCYHMSLNANMQAVLPFYVSTGDVLTFSNGKGAGQDQANGAWYCANGNLFIAGGCRGINTQDPTDPLPTDYHMAVVFQCAGSFYSTGADWTVPAGVHNQPVTFQANDANLADNSGGWSFDVCATNNQVVGGYSHRFDFAFGPQGWLIVPPLSAGWADGKFSGALTAFALENRIYLNIAAGLSITQISVDVNIEHAGSGGVEITSYPLPDCNGTGVSLYSQGLSGGSTADQNNTVESAIAVPSGAQSLLVQATGETTAAYSEIFSVTLNGLGSDPF